MTRIIIAALSFVVTAATLSHINDNHYIAGTTNTANISIPLSTSVMSPSLPYPVFKSRGVYKNLAAIAAPSAIQSAPAPSLTSHIVSSHSVATLSYQNLTEPAPTAHPPTLQEAPNTTPSLTPTALTTQTTSPYKTPVHASPQQTSTTNNTHHIFYTSSHWKAKYYYCDTDKEWRTLSAKYIKSFSSAEELLRAFPTRILHQPCV